MPHKSHQNASCGTAPQHALPDVPPYTRLNNDYKRCKEGADMFINGTFEISNVLMAFVGVGVLLIGGLLVSMRLRHRYHPSLIGALIGALFCFLLLEALPAIT
jgi:hypothetical protein